MKNAPTNTQIAKLFTQRATELIESKLILSDLTISNFIKCVAMSDVLLAVMSESLKSVSYATEFSRAHITVNKLDGSVECRLKLPQTNERLFTFGVCLLTEFDLSQRSLVSFLREYYPNPDINASFEQFSKHMFVQLKMAGEALLGIAGTKKNTDVRSLETTKADAYFLSGGRIHAAQVAFDGVSDTAQSLMVLLQRETFASQSDKNECRELLEALEVAAATRSRRLLRVCFLGVKHSMRYIRGADPLINKLENLLLDIFAQG